MKPDSQELSDRERLLRYVDGALSEEGCQEVEAWLKEDTRARALLAEMAEQAVVVADLERSQGAASKMNESMKVTASPILRGPLWLGVAAVLVACFAVGALLLSPGPDSTIARLEFVSSDAEFSPNHQLPRAVGSRLNKGWVQLERGDVRIVFRSGAVVELTGPAAFGIDTPMRSFLDFGRVRVYAPESARDFVVATESMEVVDLGTRFKLEVDRETRESNVTVSEGLVDLHLGSRGTERQIQPLEAGFTARVDASGAIVEITKPDRSTEAHTELVAHWTFDQPGEGGKIVDVAGHLNGVVRAMGLSSFAPGVSGNGLDFERNGYVDLGEHAAEVFRQPDSFTLAMWVRNPREPLAMLFSLSGDSERDRVQLHLFRRAVVYGWQDGLHYDAITGRVDGWENDRWYNLAVTCENGVVRLYCDAELIASGSVGSKIGTPVSHPSLVKNATHANLGRLEDGRQGEDVFPQGFEGQMDDVQFYSGALDQEAIQYIHQHPGKTWSTDTQDL